MSPEVEPAAIGSGPPSLTLALPGSWAQVPVHDEPRVEQLLRLVDQALGSVQSARWRARLARLASLGGDQLLVSTGEPASVVVTSWPRETARDREELLGVGAQLGDCRAIPHLAHWPAVRIDRSSPDGTAAGYLLAHPRTGRVLSLEVSIDVPDFDHPRWRTFDRLVGALEWDDAQGEESAGEARP